MSGKPRSTEIRFRGTLAFQDLNAARRLQQVVNDMLDHSLEVFWKAKGRPEMAPTLAKQLEELAQLTPHFVRSARSQSTQERQKVLNSDLDGYVRSTVDTLRQYENGKEWSLAQAERLEKGLAGVYKTLQSLMNESESEVATSLAKNCSTMIIAATDMRDKQDTHTLQSLVGNVDAVGPPVIKSLKNRVTVTSDAEDKEILEEAVRVLEQETPKMKSIAQQYRNGQADIRDLHHSCNAVILAMQKAGDVLGKHIIGDASYKHHGIDPDGFNDALDDLINAIHRGDGSGLRGAGQDLADRVRDLERRKALEDAGKNLKDQTKDLLQASKDALKNKDSEDAKKRLRDLVNNMKGDIADLAAKEQAAARRKAELLRTAGGLGQAVDGLAQAANSFRESHRTPQLNETAIDRQERKREEEVAARQQGKKPQAQNNADDELDDLLADLDNINV